MFKTKIFISNKNIEYVLFFFITKSRKVRQMKKWIFDTDVVRRWMEISVYHFNVERLVRFIFKSIETKIEEENIFFLFI